VRRAAAAALVVAALAGPARGGNEARPLRPTEARTIRYVLPSPEQAWLGAQLAPGGAPVLRDVDPSGPAGVAGLRDGDVLAAVAGVEPPDAATALWMIRLRIPGERLPLVVRRAGIAFRAEVTLDRRPGDAAPFHRGPAFRLAVVPLALEDLPRPAAPDDAALDRMYFSRGEHRGPLASGRRLHGSVRDYWRDQSFGGLDLAGRVLATVAVPAAKRVFAGQPMGAGPDSLYARAILALEARDGSAALREFDGVAFLYPGEIASAPRRGLWPHRATVRTGGRVIPYFVKNLPAGEPDPVGVHCHELGHLLGLPDQYGTAHRTGVGDFCLMAIGHRGGGESGPDRPFGLCAWCRTSLGWARPAAVDPRTPQDLALSASSGPGEFFLVPGGGDDECFLLENRRREGWDAELPGEGLLVWRAGGPAPPGDPTEGPWLDLVEAHGIAAPDASLLRPDEAPFPARGRDALTEETHPGRAGVLRLSRIRRGPGGVVTFRIADPARAAAPPPVAAPAAVDGEGYAYLADPVTGESVRVYMGRPEDAPARSAAEVEAVEPVSGD
jgi:M6 family metalloprotease-like protein